MEDMAAGQDAELEVKNQWNDLVVVVVVVVGVDSMIFFVLPLKKWSNLIYMNQIGKGEKTHQLKNHLPFPIPPEKNV